MKNGLDFDDEKIEKTLMERAINGYRIFKIQLVLSLLTIALLYFFSGGIIGAVYSSAYGASMALINTSLSIFALNLAQKIGATAPRSGVWTMGIFAALRFFLMLALFALGLGIFKLEAWPLVVAFAAVFSGQLIGSLKY